jgi:hypothetical protein
MKQFDCWIIMRMSPTGDWAVARERAHHAVLRLDDGHRAHRLVAFLEVARRALRALRARRALDVRAALALLGAERVLRLGTHREYETGQDRRDRAKRKSTRIHIPYPPLFRFARNILPHAHR